ncbi:hypothetical protein ACFL4Y_04615, partial [Gemmatimonadota bacterium]
LSEDVVRHFPGIDQFLRRSLERNPATRIRDGVAAFDALEPIAQQAGVAATLPQHVRRYATRRRTRRIRRVLLRASLVALGAMAGLLLYRQMEVAPPDLIREWTWTSRYFSPTWNGHGTKLAYYDEYGEPGEIIIRDMVDLDAPDEHHMVEGAVDLSHLAWSPTESLIAVSSDQGLFLYRPDTRHTLRLLPDVMEEISWEPGGESLVICCHPGGGTYGLGVISTSAALEDSGSNAPVVEWISVSGVHGVHLYDPVFILDGSRIAFILLDGSVHRGLWTVSRSGGQAQQIDRSGVTTTIDLRAWNLDWDESRSEILFSNRDGPDLFRMEIGPDGIALDTVEEIGIGRAVSEFDYAPASDKLALFALGSRYWIGELAREGIQESSQFRIVLDTFERDDLLQINNLALSAGAIRQVYVATLMVDRSSMGLVELDLHTGNLEPLLQSEGEFERAWQPQIDDRTGSPRVVFIGDKGGGSCVWLLEANRTYRLCEAWEAPSSPSWSGDGQSVYYAGKQRQEDRRPNRVVRVSLIEGLSGERVSQKDVILNAAEVHTRSISQPLSDSSGGFLAFQGSGDSLFAFDMRARTYVYLANGRNLSQDPSRRDLFFLDGSLIFRLRDWVTAFEKRMIPEAVALLPPHTTPAWPLRALAVSTDHIYVLLREPTPANLLLFSLGR